MNTPDFLTWLVDWFAMGGYGLYVWGSMGMCVAVFVAEGLSLRARRRALRQELAASKGDFYRGVLFQINNPLIPGYRKFVETVFQGLSPYTNSRLNVKEYATGKFAVLKAVYGIDPATSPQGYFDLIRQALGELGVAIPEA